MVYSPQLILHIYIYIYICYKYYICKFLNRNVLLLDLECNLCKKCKNVTNVKKNKTNKIL